MHLITPLTPHGDWVRGCRAGFVLGLAFMAVVLYFAVPVGTCTP